MKKRLNRVLEKTKKEDEMRYPSAALLLEISKEEYASERERSNKLDNKANVFMSAIIAVVTIFIPIIPFAKVLAVYMHSGKIKIIVTTVFLCILVVASVLLIMGFYNLFNAFKLKRFMGVNHENLNNEDMLTQSVNETEKIMVDHVNDIIKNNVEINDEKAKKIVVGLKYSVISFVLLCISAIGLIVFLGGDNIV